MLRHAAQRSSVALAVLFVGGSIACSDIDATAALELTVEAIEYGAGDVSGHGPPSERVGQLRGAIELRIESPGCEPLVLRAPDDPSDDQLLGLPIAVCPVSSSQAIVLGHVQFGGGESCLQALLIGASAGRLAVRDELTAHGSAFLPPVTLECGNEGFHFALAGCAGDACAHHGAVQPASVAAKSWSLTPEEFMQRHLGSSEQRAIEVRDGRFELVTPD